MSYLFTSESVTEGHPDKICDQISDAILTAILEQDPTGRVACETVVNTGMVIITGEITTSAVIDIPSIARDTIREIGYKDNKYGFDADTCAVFVTVDKQSPDIAMGVDNSLEDKNGENVESVGAGDQGLMFGYATKETDDYMPLPISLAHKLAKRLTWSRKSGLLPLLGPDGKTQVTVEYSDDDVPVRLDTIVVSTQHAESFSLDFLREAIIEYVIKPVAYELMDERTKIFVNPTGRFVIGGPVGDAGLTGRKIIVDTYGGYARHGGGCFSGKDATKVDRSASYAARFVAKNLVASGLAEKCEVQLAYAIGVAKPVSVSVNTFGTGKVSNKEIVEIVNKNFDLTPTGIIKMLNLRNVDYTKTSAYGHFGENTYDMPWESLIMLFDINGDIIV